MELGLAPLTYTPWRGGFPLHETFPVSRLPSGEYLHDPDTSCFPRHDVSGTGRTDGCETVVGCQSGLFGAAYNIHPGKRPTWNLNIDLWKTTFLYNPVVFRFYVNLPGCRWSVLG